MYDQIQYRAIMFCPFSLTKEEVFAHVTERDGKSFLVFDGCDNQHHKCNECRSCWENAKEQFEKSMK